MKVDLTLLSTGRGRCVVTREPGDKKFGRNREGLFLRYVARALIAQGFDVVKKQMVKDGHIVNKEQYYIRERTLKNGRQFAIFNDRFAETDAGEDYSNKGQVVLAATNLSIPPKEAP